MSNGVIIPLSLHCAIKYLLHNIMLKTKYIQISLVALITVFGFSAITLEMQGILAGLQQTFY